MLLLMALPQTPTRDLPRDAIGLLSFSVSLCPPYHQSLVMPLSWENTEKGQQQHRTAMNPQKYGGVPGSAEVI